MSKVPGFYLEICGAAQSGDFIKAVYSLQDCCDSGPKFSAFRAMEFNTPERNGRRVTCIYNLWSMGI